MLVYSLLERIMYIEIKTNVKMKPGNHGRIYKFKLCENKRLYSN